MDQSIAQVAEWDARRGSRQGDQGKAAVVQSWLTTAHLSWLLVHTCPWKVCLHWAMGTTMHVKEHVW